MPPRGRPSDHPRVSEWKRRSCHSHGPSRLALLELAGEQAGCREQRHGGALVGVQSGCLSRREGPGQGRPAAPTEDRSPPGERRLQHQRPALGPEERETRQGRLRRGRRSAHWHGAAERLDVEEAGDRRGDQPAFLEGDEHVAELGRVTAAAAVDVSRADPGRGELRDQGAHRGGRGLDRYGDSPANQPDASGRLLDCRAGREPESDRRLYHTTG